MTVDETQNGTTEDMSLESTAGVVGSEADRDNVLLVKDVTKTFPGVTALDRVALSVSRGEVHGVVGENGAGKSTLMAVVTGALSADSGTVTMKGEEIVGGKPDVARELGIAIVRQEPALAPDLTVAENLYLLTDQAHRPSPRALVQWSRAILAEWGNLPIDPQARVEQLTPQMRFIVAICGALAQQPDLLILDEPTEHLLQEEVHTLFGRVRERADAGTAVVYISHRIHEVSEISDRITVLRNGRTVGTYDAADLTQDQIINLIIGRGLDAFFPDKASADARSPTGDVLRLSAFSAADVSDLSLEFRPGEIVGLAGIEGNGQRTLLRALAGLEKSHGGYHIGSKRIRRASPARATRAGVAYLSGDRHNEGVLTGMGVEENVAFRSLGALGHAGWVTDRSVHAVSAQVVRDLDIKTPRLDTPIESLSGGNQQKALLGGMLASGASVYLVDEPTQGVDVGARAEIYALLRAAAERGAIVVVLSSSALELAGLADRVLVFSRGHVVKELVDEDLSEESITSSILTATTERQRSVRTSHKIARWFAGDVAPMVVVGTLIIALSVVGAISNGNFLGTTNVSGVLGLTVPLAIVALGQSLVLLTGGIDLSAGPLMGLVAIIGSFHIVDGASFGNNTVGWILIIAVACGVGLINWLLVELVRLAPIIATLVTYMAIQAVSLILRPEPGGSISTGVTSFLGHNWGPIPAAFVFAAVLAVAFELWLKRSRPGISIRAVGSRSEAARVNGVSPLVVRLFAYVGCSLCAGLAGIFLMVQTGIGDPTQGVTYTLTGITAAVVGGASVFGGRASFTGALLGAVLVGVVDSLTVFLHATSDWQYYLTGGITLGAVSLYSIARRRVAVRH